MSRGGLSRFFACCALAAVGGCSTEYDEVSFRKAIEGAYVEAHPGWTVSRTTDVHTVFNNDDQTDVLEVARLYAEYRASGFSGRAFIQNWLLAERAEDQARRRSLAASKDEVVPILKSQKWIQFQDLGAVNSPDNMRPWRKSVTKDVYVVLGVPEDVGVRFTSIDEVQRAGDVSFDWVERATQNLMRRLKPELTRQEGFRGKSYDGQNGLGAFEFAPVDGVSALILHPDFRASLLQMFGEETLGAAVPLRKTLIVFNLKDLDIVGAVRRKTHALYDTGKHPAFRGLLRFDPKAISVLEPADPQQVFLYKQKP